MENFQSHEYSELELDPGLNVIVGPSDYGKSALVRALRWLFYNEPRGADFIRVGARECRVKAILDDGTEIVRIRSKSGKNRYQLQLPGAEAQVFEGFGNDLPEEIHEATGMRKIFIDDRHRAELNFGCQLDGPFLLTENGAVRAKVIGQLGGVHIIDGAHKTVATDLKRLRTEESQLFTEEERLEEALEDYKHLPELEQKIGFIEEVLATIAVLEKRISAFSVLEDQWKACAEELRQAELLLNSLRELPELEEIAQEAFVLFAQLQGLEELKSAIEEIDQGLQKAGSIEQRTAGLASAEEAATGAAASLEDLRELIGMKNEWQKLNSALQLCDRVAARTETLEEAEKALNEGIERVQRMAAFKDVWREWQQISRSYDGCCLAESRYQEETEEKLLRLKDLLLKLKRCPFCFSEITGELVDRVLAEF